MFLHMSVKLFTGRGSLSGGLCPGGCGVSIPGVSVQGVSLPGGVSVWGGLCPGGLYYGDPPYGNERAVRILLECILVSHCNGIPTDL